MNLARLYQNNLGLLRDSGVEYQEVKHEPVLTYEQAAQVRTQFNLTGVESKSLFLKLKDGRYCMFVSIQGKRFDSKRLKQLLGSKPSICTDEELIEKTGCVPKAACPFGHASEITLIVDVEIFEQDRYIYSPGPPGRTIEVAAEDVRRVLAHCPNEVVYYDDR